MSMSTLIIGWTTLSSKDTALDLAKKLVNEKLAACVHVEGPLTAVFKWEGKITQDEEYKLTIKFPSEKAQELEKFLIENHPYEIPQWVAIEANQVSEKYLKWVNDVT